MLYEVITIGESARLQKLFDAELVIIHVGETKPDEQAYLDELIKLTEVNTDKLKIIWEHGKPAKKILSRITSYNVCYTKLLRFLWSICLILSRSTSLKM